MKTFNIKNLFVGTLENEAVVTLNVKQVEENGVYSLEASYCRCYIESEKIYDLEDELQTFVDDARYVRDNMETVLDWLYDYDCAPSDLVRYITYDCEGDSYKTREIFEVMGIDIDGEGFKDKAIAAAEHNEKNYYLIEDTDTWFTSYNVWGAKLAYPVFIELFALIEVYNGKTYNENIAGQIAQAVEKCNADLQEHFEVFIQYTKN